VKKALKTMVGVCFLFFLLMAGVSIPSGKVRFIPLASAGDLATLTLSLSEQQIDLGESVNMTVRITANADIPFQTRLLIFINGEVQYDAVISNLTANTTLEYIFQYTPASSGYYTIQAMLIRDTGASGGGAA